MAEQWQVQYFLMKEKLRTLKAQQKVMEVRYLVEEAKRKQAEYEERYNHYHDPHNGRFASGGGAGGGNGLYYSQGKGKGFIVGSSSPWQAKTLALPNEVAKKYEKAKKMFVTGELLEENIAKNEYGNYDISFKHRVHNPGWKSATIGVSGQKPFEEILLTTLTLSPQGNRISGSITKTLSKTTMSKKDYVQKYG